MGIMSSNKLNSQTTSTKKTSSSIHQKSRNKYCNTTQHHLCCRSKISVPSSSSGDTDGSEQQFDSMMSNFTHAMVQTKLAEIINERKGEREEAQGSYRSRHFTADRAADGRFIVLVAVDKDSCNPRKDFRDSVVEIITSEGLQKPKDLRRLLNCYISVNPHEHHRDILEVFHEVCGSLFLSSS